MDSEQVNTCPPSPSKFEVTLKNPDAAPQLDEEGKPLKVAAAHPSDLQGRTFLTAPDSHSHVKHAHIVETIDKFDEKRKDDPALIKFKLLCDRDKIKDIMCLNH